MSDLSHAKLATIWRLRCLRATHAHYSATAFFRFCDRLLTAFNVTSTVALLPLGSAYWVVNSKSETLTLWIAIAGIVAAVTSILQVTFDHRIRAKEHEAAAADYAALNRRLEALCAGGEPNAKAIGEIDTKLSNMARIAPAVPAFIWNSLWDAKIRTLHDKIFESEVGSSAPLERAQTQPTLLPSPEEIPLKPQ